MGQIRAGHVQVTNGAQRVRHVWEGRFLSVSSGPFVDGETVTWAGGGSGTAVRYDGGAKILFYVHTAGPDPAVGDTLTGGTSGASADVASQGDDDPPQFDVLLPAGQTKLFVVDGTAQSYEVSETFGSDFFDLTANYAEDSDDEAPYGVHTQFSQFMGLPFMEFGDADAPSLIRRIVQIVEASITASLTVQERQTSGTDGGGLTDATWNVRGAWTIEGANRIAGASVASSTITLPKGRYRVRASASYGSVDSNRLRLRDITNSATLVDGVQGAVGTLGGGVVPLEGEFDLAAEADVQLQHICKVTDATAGRGEAISNGQEVYAQVTLRRIY